MQFLRLLNFVQIENRNKLSKDIWKFIDNRNLQCILIKQANIEIRPWLNYLQSQDKLINRPVIHSKATNSSVKLRWECAHETLNTPTHTHTWSYVCSSSVVYRGQAGNCSRIRIFKVAESEQFAPNWQLICQNIRYIYMRRPQYIYTFA